jgi:signal recognition particle subunit SRP19
MLRYHPEHHLYIYVAKYLKANPTTRETPFRLPVRGMPLPEEPPPPPAIPRGWKMGSILPLHSPAVTGGGVSENLLKDMMNEMQGGAGASATNTPSGSKKKDKKKGK